MGKDFVIMDIDDIMCYVRRHSETYMTLNILKSMIGTLIFFCTISLIYGIVSHKYITTIIIVNMTIFYVVFVTFLNKKLLTITYYQRFLFSGVGSLYFSLFFLMMAYLLIEVGMVKRTEQITYGIVLGFMWMLSVMSVFMFKINNIRKGVYKKLKPGRLHPGLVIASLIGGVAGISFMRIVSKWLTQQVAINLGILLFFIISVLFALGIPHLLISYFVKTYSILGESISVKRHKKSKHKEDFSIRHPILEKVKRIMIKVLIIMVILLIIVVILGVLVDKGILK